MAWNKEHRLALGQDLRFPFYHLIIAVRVEHQHISRQLHILEVGDVNRRSLGPRQAAPVWYYLVDEVVVSIVTVVSLETLSFIWMVAQPLSGELWSVLLSEPSLGAASGPFVPRPTFPRPDFAGWARIVGVVGWHGECPQSS
jgi:hypothetical protein